MSSFQRKVTSTGVILFIFLEKLKNDLLSKHQSEMEKLTEGFNSQIAHLKQDLANSTTIKSKLVSYFKFSFNEITKAKWPTISFNHFL